MVLKKPFSRRRDSETSNQMKKEGEILRINWKIWRNKNMENIWIHLSICFQLIRNYQLWNLSLPMTQLNYKKRNKRKKKIYKICNNSRTFNLESTVPWFRKMDWYKNPLSTINKTNKYGQQIKMVRPKTLTVKNKRGKIKIRKTIKSNHKTKMLKILKILMITNQKKWINQCYLTIKNRNWTHFHKVKNNNMNKTLV